MEGFFLQYIIRIREDPLPNVLNLKTDVRNPQMVLGFWKFDAVVIWNLCEWIKDGKKKKKTKKQVVTIRSY